MSPISPPVRTVVVIPARGGSKGVPAKNLSTVGGVSLVARAVASSLRATRIDAVYVSTDDDHIADAALRAGGQVIRRPAEIAGDLSSSESVLLHALEQLDRSGQQPAVLVFVQCTSPFINPADLDVAVDHILSGRADSAFSGLATHELLWRDVDSGESPGAGAMIGQNHDAARRPRRQDRRPDFKETGAFYAMTTAGFQAHQHRFFGRTAVVPVSDLTAVEIDTPHDLILAEALAKIVDVPVGRPVDVDAVITDFDGVHTPDTVYLDQTGRESVRVSRSDGLGIGLLRAAGIPMLIVSKERNPVVTARARKLGVEVLQGVDDKGPAVRSWLARRQISAERAAYLGNDLNDLDAMRTVGWPVAVQDARPEVLAVARLTLSRPGGQGAVRELCDLVVAAAEPRTNLDAAAAAVSTAGAAALPSTGRTRRGPGAPGGAGDVPSGRVSQPV